MVGANMEGDTLTKARRWLTVLSAILFAVLSGQLVHAQEVNKPLIGFSFEAMKGERWQTDLSSFEVRAKQLGAEVISRDADGDDDRQFQQVQDMIKTGVKVLVLRLTRTARPAGWWMPRKRPTL